MASCIASTSAIQRISSLDKTQFAHKQIQRSFLFSTRQPSNRRSVSQWAAPSLNTPSSMLPSAPAPASSNNPALALLQRFFATEDSSQVSQQAVILALVVASTALLSAHPAMAASSPHDTNPLYDIAENEEFWSNVLRYISYFFSVLLGTAYVAVKPIVELLKRPTTAILVIVAAAGLYFFVSTTVGAMLGLNDVVEYNPSSIVTPQL